MCFFLSQLTFLQRKRNFCLLWPLSTNVGYFVAKLRIFCVLFTGLNSVVVYQNWQISGMLFLKVMVEMEGLDFSNTEIAPLSLVREITPRQYLLSFEKFRESKITISKRWADWIWKCSSHPFVQLYPIRSTKVNKTNIFWNPGATSCEAREGASS